MTGVGEYYLHGGDDPGHGQSCHDINCDIHSNGHDSNNMVIGPDVEEGGVSNTKTGKESDKNEDWFRCFYCNEFCSYDEERVAHIDYAHPGKLYYPTPEDFENRLRPN
jgi:hypothetical protein